MKYMQKKIKVKVDTLYVDPQPCIFENLRNLEIALCILGIPRLRTTVTRSRDCALQSRDLEIAHL